MEARIGSISALFLVAALQVAAPASLDASGCAPPDLELPEAVVVTAHADEADLVATLRWHPDADPTIPRELVLRDLADAVVATVPVVPADGFPEEVLPGVLNNLNGQGFQIFLRVESAFTAGSPPLPLFPLRRCLPSDDDPRGDCFWQVLAGVESEAVMVSAELDGELDALPGCDLDEQLIEVEQKKPYLAEEVEQLRQQLQWNLLTSGKGNACRYFWQGVAESSEPFTIFYQELSADDSMPDAEIAGFKGGAGQCQLAQARRLSPGLTLPPVVANEGFSGLTLELRCYGSIERCKNGCAGDVAVMLDYQVCAEAEAVSGPQAAGKARGREEVYLTLNNTLSLQDEVEALSTSGLVRDGDHLTYMDQDRAPLTATLWTLREFEVAAGYLISMGADPDPLWFSGFGYAHTEVGNHFTLKTVGRAEATCAITRPSVRVVVESPDYPTLGQMKRGGSIKIEKW